MDEYIEKQNLLNKLITKISKDTINVQAYLLVCENNKILQDSSILLAKSLICPHSFKKNCIECNICKSIDDQNYGELINIYPVNNIIKKEEILNIRDKFSTYSVHGKNQVYIINNVEYLGDSAANTLLKFLEEPDSNTVAIFTTTALNKVLDTIISRCQVIKLNSFNKEGLDFVKSFCDCEDEEKIKKYIDIIINVEKNEYEAVVNVDKKKWLKIVTNKEDLTILMNLWILIYEDLLNKNIFNNYKYFNNLVDIEDIFSKNNIKTIVNKLSFLMENLEKIHYNININLFLVNVIIGIGDINNG